MDPAVGSAASDARQRALSPGQQARVIAALGCALATYSVSMMMLLPLIPTLERELVTSVDTAALIVTFPLLTAIVAVPVMARWGEQSGRKRVLLVALVALALGSLLAAIAPNVGLLLLAQAIRGLGAGAFPMVFSIVRHECDDTHRRVGVGVIGGCNFLGQGLGGVIAGLLLLYVGEFRAAFWFSLAIALAAIGVSWVALPAPRPGERGREAPDVAGAVTFGTALVCILVALTYGGSWGWDSALTLGLIAATALLILLWVRVERRAANPMIELRTLRIPIVWRGNAGGFVAGIALFGAAAGVATFLQLPHAASGFELTVLGSAWVILPLDLMMLVGGPLVGYLARFVSPRNTMVLGSLVIAAAFGVLEAQHGSVAVITVLMGCVGLGTALTFTSIGILFTEEVPPADTGPALGFNYVLSLVGSAFSGTLLGVVLAAHTHAVGAVPDTSGFTTFWGIGIVAALAAAAIMGIGPRRPATTTQRETTNQNSPRRN